MTTFGEHHLLLRVHGVFGGNYASPLEHWSYGMRIKIGLGLMTEGAKEDFLTAIHTAVNSFHTASGNKVSGSAWLTKTTAAYIGTDGLYVGGDSQPTTEDIWATPVKGLGASDQPYSTAYAVTLDTGLPRGPGSKGRFYVPVGWPVDTSGRWIVGDVTTMAAGARTLLNAINTAAVDGWGADAGVHVMSTVAPYPVGRVIRVGVGRAPDTQRRRDNKLLEEHVWDNLTVALAAREDARERTYLS